MQISFRDPDGFVFRSGDRILRCVFPHAAPDLRSFLASDFAAASISDGILADTRILGEAFDPGVPAEVRQNAADGSLIVEQTPIAFANYPYEWAPQMLLSAANLTLRLARAAMAAGFALKDATPYNIMFEGARPVFIDVLSFARLDPLDPIWRPYSQFVRTFVYPLLARRHFGLRLDELLLVHRDGLEPERMWRICPLWRLLTPRFLGSVTMPAVLSHMSGAGAPHRFRERRARTRGEAGFLLGRLFGRASRLLPPKRVPARESAASRYMESGRSYSPDEFAEKERLVAGALERWRPRRVLDVGCNTGHFSMLAARQGARVVAIDRDPDSVDALWTKASESRLDILPLVIDISRPPGACGWANSESPSFLDRAEKRFDCVLMLGLIHHLLVSERIPVGRVFDLVANLTTNMMIIEYIDPADSQFQLIARGREALHRDLTRESFEAAARHNFRILESDPATPTRWIYQLRRESA